MRSKASVDYSEGMKSAHCGICKHYRSPGSCELVEGDIDPGYWCELFARSTNDARTTDMPLTEKGSKIKSAMESEYGKEKGERVFYASKNAGKISGVDRALSKDRRTIKRFLDEAAAAEEVDFPSNPVSSKPADAYENSMYDALPTKDAFRKRVRDAVRAGEPLPKVLQFGNTWGTGKGGHDTWQMQDKARVRRRFRDALGLGFGTQDAIRIADADVVAGSLKLGEVSGRGQPMSGPDRGADKPDADDKSRHFFKGSAKDAVRRFVDRPAGLRARRAVPRRAL